MMWGENVKTETLHMLRWGITYVCSLNFVQSSQLFTGVRNGALCVKEQQKRQQFWNVNFYYVSAKQGKLHGFENVHGMNEI
jgi:hypothetical protein